MIFSNASDEIARRLLELYPLELMKKEYQVTGTSDKAYDEIIKNNSFADIKENALRMLGVCRQHIYLFRHDFGLNAHKGDFIAKNSRSNLCQSYPGKE